MYSRIRIVYEHRLRQYHAIIAVHRHDVEEGSQVWLLEIDDTIRRERR